MRGVFFRLWLVACLVGGLGLAAYDFGWAQYGDESEDRYYEDTFGPLVELAVETLQHAGNPEPARQALEAKLGYPVAVIDQEAAPAEALEYWDEGYRVAYVYEDAGELMMVPIEGDRVVVMGPLPPWSYLPNRIHGGVTVLVGVVMALLLGAAMWPLHVSQRRLEQAALRMARGDLSARVEVARSATKSVARAFNHMARRTQSRVEDQRTLLRAVSHELRTPISRLHVAVDLLIRAEGANQARHAQGIQRDLEELDGVIGELLGFVRASDPTESMRPTDLAPLVRSVAEREAPHAELDLASLQADVAPQRFQWVVRNLVRNAVIHGGDRVRVALKPPAVLVIDDDGDGIPEADRTRVLQPFVRLDPSTPGTGLGLAIAARIVAQHGGILGIEASPSGGTRVVASWTP